MTAFFPQTGGSPPPGARLGLPSLRKPQCPHSTHCPRPHGHRPQAGNRGGGGLGPTTRAGEAAKGHLPCPREGRALNPVSAPAPRADCPGQPLRAPGRSPSPGPDSGISVNPANPTPASEVPLGATPVTTPNTGRPLAAGVPASHPRWRTRAGAQGPRERKPHGWGLRTEGALRTRTMPTTQGSCMPACRESPSEALALWGLELV